MRLQNTSLQTRLTLLVLGTVLLFSLLAGYESYKNALHEADEIFDAQLAQFAQSLVVLSATFDDEQAEPMPPPVHKYQQTLAFQVWITDKQPPRILLRSNNISSMLPAQTPAEGFSSGEWQGERWRYFRLRDKQRGFDVLVGQNDKARSDLAQKVAWHNTAPFLFGLPLLALFVMLAIYFGLRPLRKLTESLRQLSPEQLSPVTVHDTPKEIAPVIDALNSLLGRIARTIENERRFTADASHELRTPLAALHAQVQAAQLSASESERKECLVKALQGADRMAHLVGQLLTLSRLDELSSPINLEPVNLAELTRECCAELGENALSKNIEIGFSPEAHPALSGSPDMLRIMLRNLLDNAIRYTPQGGHVEAALHPTDDGQQVELEIADSGIGVAGEQLALLGQRFSRINPGMADGVGLGLSIVQRIAEIHRAKITFNHATALGGLSVKVCFPLP
ncbi:MAG: sensor histidine kinase N-terminal domain-containing protein [Nitrosomonadales bacterium]|nr:sensor histidine kinase N-terminal domain-containing protein [Nitrosomonadales bacterium]